MSDDEIFDFLEDYETRNGFAEADRRAFAFEVEYLSLMESKRHPLAQEALAVARHRLDGIEPSEKEIAYLRSENKRISISLHVPTEEGTIAAHDNTPEGRRVYASTGLLRFCLRNIGEIDGYDVCEKMTIFFLLWANMVEDHSEQIPALLHKYFS